MKFRFRFERILHTRKLLEERGVDELARLKNEKSRHADEVSQLTDRQQRMMQEATPAEGDLTTVRVLLDYLQELTRLQRAIEEEQAAIETLEQQIEDQRERVRQLHKQRRIFEKLKERDLKEHRVEEIRRDQRAMDEHVTMRHGRSDGLSPIG